MANHSHHGVDRIDRILDAVARAAEPPRLADITAVTGLARSTTADLVTELRLRGYLTRTGTRYRLGRRMQVLAMIAGMTPASVIDHRELERLSRIARTPLTLAALVGSEVLYLDSAGPRAPQRLQQIADNHHPRPALRTAAGRLLVAFADDEKRNAVLRAAGATDPESVAAFLHEMPSIQRAQLARSDGLADPGIRAIALPIYEEGAVTSALVLLGPRPATRATPSAWIPLEQGAKRILTEDAVDARE